MQCAFVSTPIGMQVNMQIVNMKMHLSAINERLSLALESSRQIAFDWHIPDDRLYFSGELADNFKGVALETSKTWSSNALPAIIHDDDKEQFRRHLHDALRGTGDADGALYRTELRLKDTLRAWRWVDISGRVVEHDADGRAIRMVGTFSDIDERKQNERKIARLRDMYVALSQTNQAIVRINDRDTLFREICRIAVEHGRFHMAWIGLVDRDSKQVMCAAAYGKGLNILQEISIYADETRPEGRGVIGTAIRENRPEICNDFTSALNLLYCREAALKSGFLSLASFPFHLSGQPVGALTLYSAEKDFFDEQMTSLLSEMTANISFAIANYEREAQRKWAEALQLGQNRILNMVATGTALPEILSELVQFAESQSERGVCTIRQLNNEGTLLGGHIALGLPQTYCARFGETAVGTNGGSCSTSAFRAEPVIVTDIATDPLWASKRELALEHGLKACSSWPIFGKNRKVLGTFALYSREPVAPTEKDWQLMQICTNLAGIAIESRASDEKIRYLAHYDGLTSLPNRFLFKEYLDLALRNAKRHGKKFAVFFLDLDKFKEINDTFGHDAGDLVLREIARRLCNCLRHTDKIARMGGDEFYVLIEELDNGHYAADVAQKLLDETVRPVRVGDQNYQISVSIGISIYPKDGDNEQALLKNADCAMYRAKALGKNAYQFFSLPTGCDKDAPELSKLPVLPHIQNSKIACIT